MLQQAGDINACGAGHVQRITENVKISRTSRLRSKSDALA
jgi:hypothetical protein